MILISICGRAGSKGVPGKNIREIGGKPLIAYSIEIAIEFAKRYPAKVAISTDSDDILSIAQKYGVQTNYKRPEHLANDTAGKVAVFKDLLQYEENLLGNKYDYYLDLDITSPLRTIVDLEKAYSQLINNTEAVNLFSVSHARKNPYFNMVETTEQGYCKLVKERDSSFLTRQSAPKVYEINASFYFFKRSYFESNYATVITPKTLAYVMPELCMDIDNETEFQVVKFLIESKLVKTI